jgi:hypothetical protein
MASPLSPNAFVRGCSRCWSDLADSLDARPRARSAGIDAFGQRALDLGGRKRSGGGGDDRIGGCHPDEAVCLGLELRFGHSVRRRERPVPPATMQPTVD